MVEHALTVSAHTSASVRPGTREPAVRRRSMNVHRNLASMAQRATITLTRLSASVLEDSVALTVRLTTMTARQGLTC